MQGLWARIIIRYQLCDELSVMWSHSPLSSCAQQQQQHRWRCVSLSFCSTVMQEWCFKTVYREKKSQTPHPLLSDRATLPSNEKEPAQFIYTAHTWWRWRRFNYFYIHPSACVSSYRPVYNNSFCIIAVICTHAYSNNMWEFSHMNALLLLITVFHHGSLV